MVYRPILETAETGEYRGREGFRRFMGGFFKSDWARGLAYQTTSLRDYGDAVIASVRISGKGRASGLDFGARISRL